MLGGDVVVAERRAPRRRASRARENAGETLRLLPAAAARRAAPRTRRSASGRRPCQSAKSSWSSSASSRCSGVISGLPRRRASSCAAATASCSLIVNLLKSMSPRPCRRVVLASRHASWSAVAGAGRERARAGTGGAPRRARSRISCSIRSSRRRIRVQLVLEQEHALDTREVEAELARQPLDQAQPLDVGVGVEPRVAGRALRAHEPLLLVDAQRLRVHADEVGGDRDHVARASVVAHPVAFRSSSSSSRSLLR